MKVLENCNTIVASSLEQTTWLRKTFQVRVTQPDIQSLKSTSTSNQSTPQSINFASETGTIHSDDPVDFDG